MRHESIVVMSLSAKSEEVVSLKEAVDAVESTARRVALLHLAYARTLVDELGEKRGRELIAKAINEFGVRIGERTRQEVIAQGLKPTVENFSAGESYAIPRFGMSERGEMTKTEDETRVRVYGCTLAKVWKEYAEEKLGRLYCYVDPAKFMGYDLNYKQIHTKTILDGNECCEMTMRKTTEKERRDFTDKKSDWLYVDK